MKKAKVVLTGIIQRITHASTYGILAFGISLLWKDALVRIEQLLQLYVVRNLDERHSDRKRRHICSASTLIISLLLSNIGIES